MKTFAALCLGALLTAGAGAAAAQEQAVAAGQIQNTFDGRGRVASAAPARTSADPRAEPAIRAFIGGLQTGAVDWSVFTDNMVDQIRPQEAAAAEAIKGLGALESVEWMEHRDGADLFLVRFEQIDTQWVIGFDAAGKIGALLFRPAPPIQAEPAS